MSASIHISEDFASIFEDSYHDGEWDSNLFYILRDDFYQNHRAFLLNGDETIDEFQAAISREPVLANEIYLRFACATIRYYCNQLGALPPDWAFQFDGSDIEIMFPINSSYKRLGDEAQHTPEEFRNLGLIYDEKNLFVI